MLLLVSLLGGAGTSVDAIGPPCDGGFHVVHAGDDPASLQAVDLAGATGWAAGFHSDDEGFRDRPFLVRFDAGSYERVAAPPPARGHVYLNGVAARDSGEVFVAGTQKRRRWRSVVVHWDGVSWQRMTTPQPGRGAFLNGIAAPAQDDVWAVGRYEVAGGRERNLVLHFDGTRWSRVPAPDAGRRYMGLNGVDGMSSDDMWAVGWGGRGGERGVVLHYDGESWEQVGLPGRLARKRVDLNAVEVEGPGDVWISGRKAPSRGSLALVLHRDGSSWDRDPLPDVRGHEWLFDLAVIDDVAWAVGWHFVPEIAYPFAVRWTGAWERVATDAPRSPGELVGVAADDAGNLWAVGESEGSGWVISRACPPEDG